MVGGQVWMEKDTRTAWDFEFELVLILKMCWPAVGSPWRRCPMVLPVCWVQVEVLDLVEMLMDFCCVWMDCSLLGPGWWQMDPSP